MCRNRNVEIGSLAAHHCLIVVLKNFNHFNGQNKIHDFSLGKFSILVQFKWVRHSILKIDAVTIHLFFIRLFYTYSQKFLLKC